MPRDGKFARELRPRLPGAASPSKVASTFLQQRLQVSAQPTLLMLRETKMKEAVANGFWNVRFLDYMLVAQVHHHFIDALPPGVGRTQGWLV